MLHAKATHTAILYHCFPLNGLLLCCVLQTRTLAVGCNDLGKFIECHPHGRYIVSDLRGKELVMRLMVHPDPEVQKRALLCVQKIMLPRDKLDFLQSSSS